MEISVVDDERLIAQKEWRVEHAWTISQFLEQITVSPLLLSLFAVSCCHGLCVRQASDHPKPNHTLHLLFYGDEIPPDVTFAEAGIEPGATVTLHYKDAGSIIVTNVAELDPTSKYDRLKRVYVKALVFQEEPFDELLSRVKEASPTAASQGTWREGSVVVRVNVGRLPATHQLFQQPIQSTQDFEVDAASTVSELLGSAPVGCIKEIGLMHYEMCG